MASNESHIVEEKIKVYVRLKPVNFPEKENKLDFTIQPIDQNARSVRRDELSARVIAEELSPIEKRTASPIGLGIAEIQCEGLDASLKTIEMHGPDDLIEREGSGVKEDDSNLSSRTLNKTADQILGLKEDETTKQGIKEIKAAKKSSELSLQVADKKIVGQLEKPKEIVFRKEKENFVLNLKSGDAYEYESAFDDKDTNKDLFNKIIRPNFDYIFDGNNFSVFMYGQTNSGKTFTMRGDGIPISDGKASKNCNPDFKCCSGSKSLAKGNFERSFHFESSLRKNDHLHENKGSKGTAPNSAQKGRKNHTNKCIEAENNEGCVQKTLKHLFKLLNTRSDCNFKCQISYFEIYNENIYDLLTNCDAPLEIRENKEGKPVVANLKILDTNNYEEAIKAYEFGETRRQFAATSMNHNSSRSHVVLQIKLEIRYKARPFKSYHSNVILADLAGSECIGKWSKDSRFKEGTSINKSLLYLSNLIKKLNKGTQNVSFRESKLTRILQPALTGNSRTAVICTLNPLDEFYSESINTLRFGISAGGVKLKIKQAEVMKTKEEKNEQYNSVKQELEDLKTKYTELIEDNTDKGIEVEFLRSRLIALEAELESVNLYIVNLESQNKEMKHHNEFLQTQITEINRLKQSCEKTRAFANATSTVREHSAFKSRRKETRNSFLDDRTNKIIEENQSLKGKVTELEFKLSFRPDISTLKPLSTEGFKPIKKINCSPGKEEILKWNKQLAKKINKLEADEEKYLINEKKLKNMVVEKNSEILKLRKLISMRIKTGEPIAPEEESVYN